MVNVYTTDQNERMERLDRISSLVGNYLLRGYKMLASECGTCGTVLLENRQKETYCVGCQEVDRVPDNEQHPPPPPNVRTLITDVPADMSREDLYAMLSQQATQNERREQRRTPTPPPRLLEAARAPAPGPSSSSPDTLSDDPTDSEIRQSITALCRAISSCAGEPDLSNSTDIKQYAEAVLALKQALSGQGSYK